MRDSILTLRKLIACSRLVLVKLTKFAMASSVGSEAMTELYAIDQQHRDVGFKEEK